MTFQLYPVLHPVAIGLNPLKVEALVNPILPLKLRLLHRVGVKVQGRVHERKPSVLVLTSFSITRFLDAVKGTTKSKTSGASAGKAKESDGSDTAGDEQTQMHNNQESSSQKETPEAIVVSPKSNVNSKPSDTASNPRQVTTKSQSEKTE